MKNRKSLGLMLVLMLLPLTAFAFPPYPPHQLSPAPGPSLGVMVKEIPFPELAQLGLDHGVRIVQILPDSPAQQAGLQTGDIIQELNDKPVYSARRLRWLVINSNAEPKLSIRYLRGNEQIETNLSLGNQTLPAPKPAPMTPPSKSDGEAFLGVHLQAMTPQLREAFGAPENTGVLIAKIVDGSAADSAGLQAGDIITQIDGVTVRETRDIYRYLDSKSPGDRIDVNLIRANQTRNISVDLGERQPESPSQWWKHSENAKDMRDFLPPPEYWRQLMDHMMRSLEESMDEMRKNWPEEQRQETY